MSVAYHHGQRGDANAADIAGESRPRFRISVRDDFAGARAAWQSLERTGAIATPYQRLEWLTLWHSHVSGPAGQMPLIVVGEDDAGTRFVWPFVRRTHGPLTVASFFGGRHANLNSGVWRRDAALSMTGDDITRVLADVGHAHSIDLFSLTGQPARIGEIDNPFSRLAHQRSPDDVHAMTFEGLNGKQALEAGLSQGMRQRLRRKERKLQQLDGYRYARARNASEADRHLDAFFEQKDVRLRGRGIANDFTRPDIQAFLRAACHDGLDQGRPVIELHALEGGGEVIAVFGGVSDGRRLSCMFNSYTTGENRRWSPGLILMSHIVRDCADRQHISLDFGVGNARYKSFYCKVPENVFDTFVPITPLGQLAALVLRSSQGLKRWIKANASMRVSVDALRRHVLS
jgi:CelD/BcsL family acetyltransferase involved in cellulose biosynthesis